MTTTRPTVLVTGSRTWTNEFLIHNVLTSFHWMFAGDLVPELVSGKCPKGADTMCERVAYDLGWIVRECPAQWDVEGRGAGFKRNERMAAYVAASDGPKICLAFIQDDSKGATHCAATAEEYGIQTLRYKRYTREPGLSATLPDEKGDAEPSDPDILRGVETITGRAGTFEGSGDHR